MSIPIILQALAALAPHANKIVEGIRTLSSKTRSEERVEKLEADLLRAGEIIVGLTAQLQALAEELRLQAELNAAREKRATQALVVALAALCLGAGALGFAAFK